MVILYIVMSYLIVGVLFAVVFVTRLIVRLDKAAVGAPWSFRLLIFPGCVVLWPILLNKYQKIRRRKND
jgi:hypothetical protein